MVLIISIIASAFFAFMLMNVIQGIQEAVNPVLAESNWISEEHYTAFYYAALLVTNVWFYIIVIIFFILAYWAYIYSQRKEAGYA